MTDQIDAIRAVRTAAHNLANACAAVVGGTGMALSITTAPTIAEPIETLTSGVTRKARRRRRRG